jgi:hypothetical protein
MIEYGKHHIRYRPDVTNYVLSETTHRAPIGSFTTTLSGTHSHLRHAAFTSEMTRDLEFDPRAAGRSSHFDMASLSLEIREAIFDHQASTSTTLTNGTTSPMQHGRVSAAGRAEARERWQRAYEYTLRFLGSTDSFTMKDLDTINILLRYEQSPENILEFTRLSDEKSMLWERVRDLLWYCDGWTPEITALNEEINRDYKSRFKGVGCDLFTHPLFRNRMELTGAFERRGETLQGYYMHYLDARELRNIVIETLRDETLHPVVKAAKLYQDIVTLHVFGNANGRTARLVANMVLMSHGYPPLQFPDGNLRVGNPIRFENKGGRSSSDAKPDEFRSLKMVVKRFIEDLEATEAWLNEQDEIAYDMPAFTHLSDEEYDLLTFVPVRDVPHIRNIDGKPSP